MRIIGTRAELQPCRRNAYVTNGILVGLDCLEIVQELIPELDDTQLITAN